MHAEESRSTASAAAWHKTLAKFKLTDLLDLDRRYVPLSLPSKFIKSLDNGTQEPPTQPKSRVGNGAFWPSRGFSLDVGARETCPFRSVPSMKIPILLKKLYVHLRHFFAIHTLF